MVWWSVDVSMLSTEKRWFFKTTLEQLDKMDWESWAAIRGNVMEHRLVGAPIQFRRQMIKSTNFKTWPSLQVYIQLLALCGVIMTRGIEKTFFFSVIGFRSYGR